MLLFLLSMAVPKFRRKAMKKFSALAVAFAATAILSATPLMAKDIAIKTPDAPQAPAVSAPETPKADFSSKLGDKTTSLKDQAKEKLADQAREKVDNAANNLKQKLPGQKEGVGEVLKQESVTVETPSGAAQETITTITPETPAK